MPPTPPPSSGLTKKPGALTATPRPTHPPLVSIHTEYASPTFIHQQQPPNEKHPRRSLKLYRSESDLRRLKSIFLPSSTPQVHLPLREKKPSHPLLSTILRPFAVARTPSQRDSPGPTLHKSESAWHLWRHKKRQPSLASLKKSASQQMEDNPTPTSGRSTPFADLMMWNRPSEGSILHLSENGQEVLLMERIDGRFQVLAGTVDKLFVKLADETVQDFDYVDAYILNHTEFITSDEFLENLMARFYLEPQLGELDYFNKWQRIIQTKVLHVILRWIKLQFMDFKCNPVLLTRLRAFITGDIPRAGFLTEATSLCDLLDSQESQHDQPRHVIIQAIAKYNRGHQRPASPESPFSPLIPSMPDSTGMLLSLSSKELAQSLTLADFYLLKCITPFDILHHVRKPHLNHCSYHENYIDRLTKRANQLGDWVHHMVYSHSGRTRSLLLKKIIDIAKFCLEWNNFHTSMILTTSLLQPSIQKLQEWSSVAAQEDLTALMGLLDVSNNMYVYRQALGQAKPPLVPFFPLLLKDLTFTMDGNATVYAPTSAGDPPTPLPYFSNDQLINFAKYRTLTQCLHGVLRATFEDYAFSALLGDWLFVDHLQRPPDPAYPLDQVASVMEQSLWSC
ncbi:ras GEF [Hesseltinella vesiculosa]|uniref:Ras GEF n=1 Tax=Hesseltinella vesiculosa TaxID=101127 RepID=A0A1X2GAW4_9FUNG|nr:ras GEF [Hesseltinella vesiculosa]